MVLYQSCLTLSEHDIQACLFCKLGNPIDAIRDCGNLSFSNIDLSIIATEIFLLWRIRYYKLMHILVVQSSLLSPHIIFKECYTFHLTTEVTRLTLKRVINKKKKVLMQVKGGRQWKWRETNRETKQTKMKLSTKSRSFPCHAASFKKPQIIHTSTENELKSFVRFSYFSSQKKTVVLNNNI